MRKSRKLKWWKWTRRLLLEFFLTAFNITFFFYCIWTAEEIGNKLRWGPIRIWMCMFAGSLVGLVYIALVTLGRIRLMEQRRREKKILRRKRVRESKKGKNEGKRKRPPRSDA